MKSTSTRGLHYSYYFSVIRAKEKFSVHLVPHAKPKICQLEKFGEGTLLFAGLIYISSLSTDTLKSALDHVAVLPHCTSVVLLCRVYPTISWLAPR